MVERYTKIIDYKRLDDAVRVNWSRFRNCLSNYQEQLQRVIEPDSKHIDEIDQLLVLTEHSHPMSEDVRINNTVLDDRTSKAYQTYSHIFNARMNLINATTALEKAQIGDVTYEQVAGFYELAQLQALNVDYNLERLIPATFLPNL